MATYTEALNYSNILHFFSTFGHKCPYNHLNFQVNSQFKIIADNIELLIKI